MVLHRPVETAGDFGKFESPAHAFGVDGILNTHPATNRVAA
jgi:hypothetical protein